jgi:hypothetical protein
VEGGNGGDDEAYGPEVRDYTDEWARHGGLFFWARSRGRRGGSAWRVGMWVALGERQRRSTGLEKREIWEGEERISKNIIIIMIII